MSVFGGLQNWSSEGRRQSAHSFGQPGKRIGHNLGGKIAIRQGHNRHRRQKQPQRNFAGCEYKAAGAMLGAGAAGDGFSTVWQRTQQLHVEQFADVRRPVDGPNRST